LTLWSSGTYAESRAQQLFQQRYDDFTTDGSFKRSPRHILRIRENTFRLQAEDPRLREYPVEHFFRHESPFSERGLTEIRRKSLDLHDILSHMGTIRRTISVPETWS